MPSHYSILETEDQDALVPLQRQDLSHILIGKWTIYKYQWSLEVPFLKNIIEFFPNGIFKSDVVYFRRKKGTFKTDQDKSILIMDTKDGDTQWRVTFYNNYLHLKCGLTGQTQSLMLVKREPTEISVIIS